MQENFKEEFKQIVSNSKKENPDNEEEQLNFVKKALNKKYWEIYKEKIKILEQHWFTDDQLVFDYLKLIVQMCNIIISIKDPDRDDIYELTYFNHQLKLVVQMYWFFNPDIFIKILDNIEIKIEQEKEVKAVKKEKQEENNDEDVPLPLPKLSRLFTREDIPEQKTNFLFKRTFSYLKETQNECTFEDLYQMILNKQIKFISLFLENGSHNKSWIRLVEGNPSIKLSPTAKFNYIRKLVEENIRENDERSWENLRINLDRDQVWFCTKDFLSRKSSYSLIHNDFDIRFEGERGIDAGGLTTEWTTLVSKEIMSPNFGLFKLSANKSTLQPNPLSYIIPNHLVHFRFLGRLVAISLIKNLPIQIDLTKSFLKHITKQPLYISDLDDIDPELAKSLLQILEIPVEDLCLTYNHYERVFDELVCVDLGKGFDEPVTEENKKEYVKAVANYKMTIEIKDQTESFIQGFEDIIPRKFFGSLDAKEIGLKLSGLKTIDFDDFKENVHLERYKKSDEQIIWFFEIVKDFDQQQRANLLFFITGSFKVHYNGFKEMGLTISKKENPDVLPIAHTCFKEIELPIYSSKEIMEQKLIMAINEGSKGFYIA